MLKVPELELSRAGSNPGTAPEAKATSPGTWGDYKVLEFKIKTEGMQVVF